MKRSILSTCAAIAVVLLTTACNKQSDFVAPSFIHLDGISVVPPATNAITTDTGFYTSDIVAAYVVAHYPNAGAVDTIGLYEMPFTAPVLHSGDVDYIEIYPAVQQSGSSAALPFYTFYNRIRISDTALHSGDTLQLGHLTTTYNLNLSDVLMYEMFEPTEANLLFDSVMLWERHAPDQARCGEGYGYIHIEADESSKNCFIDRDFYVIDPTKLLYLELDTRSDKEYAIFMEAAYTSGGNTDRLSVMNIRPSTEWKHIYVNLGRTWREFNHSTKFRIFIRALNLDGTEGDVRIDNVRLLTTSVVL